MNAYDRLFRILTNAENSGKVLDVSKIKENGTGARVMNEPGERSQKNG